jgi:hypothetical protein
MSSITFEEAIELSSQLLNHIERGELETASAPEHIAEIVKEAPGARGFLVAYLTGESRIAEEHPSYVLHGLSKSEALVSDLITKNLVMSSTMAVLHRRNGNEALLAGSTRVQRRSLCLAQGMASRQLRQHFSLMLEAIRLELPEQLEPGSLSENVPLAGNPPDYSSFLKRWKYDPEQLRAAEEALVAAIASIS